MAPVKGQSVHLYLRYGIEVEGVVSEWSEDQIVLTANGSHLIIYNPKEDLIMAKIMGKSRLSNVIPNTQDAIANLIASPTLYRNTPAKPNESPIEKLDTVLANDYTVETQTNEIEKEFEATVKSPSNNLRTKKLAELKALLNQAEKEVIAAKLNDHKLSPEEKPIKYANQFSLFRKPT